MENGYPLSQPFSDLHSHTAEEILLYIGIDSNNLRGAGKELEITMDDEVHKVDTTTAIFIPKGVKHSNKVNKFERPVLNLKE